MDAITLSRFNSREQDEDDWRLADEKFEFLSAKKVKENSDTDFMVARWT